jgi:crossover junction endodeoxyribonuclease RuvC
MKILSVDPGYERLGLSILEKEKGGSEELIYSETFKTSPKKNFLDRLFEIGKRTEKIIEEFNPEYLAIEKLFFNTNQKTATNVSEVRGVIIYSCQKKGMKIKEFTPLEIKVAVAGHGRASKDQVISMTEKLIKIKQDIKYDDEYDAIACGLTFFAHHRH